MNPILVDVLKIAAPVAILILQQIYAYLSKKRAERIAEDFKKNEDSIRVKLQEIHILVNSNLSTATTRVASLMAEMEQLREIITRLTPPPESIVSLTKHVADLQARVNFLDPPPESLKP